MVLILIGQILQVKLIDSGFSFLDFLSILSTVLGIGSALYVFKEKYSQKKSERMKLLVTPMSKATNHSNSYFFIEFAFSNESSLPISLIGFKIKHRNQSLPDTDKGEGGKSISKPLPIIDEDSQEQFSKLFNPDIKYPDIYSEKLPLVIPPYESRGGFIAFHVNEFDYLPLQASSFSLEINTSRSKWSTEMQIYSDNMSDFTYTGNGVIGDAVIQSTKLQRLLFRLRKRLKQNI